MCTINQTYYCIKKVIINITTRVMTNASQSVLFKLILIAHSCHVAALSVQNVSWMFKAQYIVEPVELLWL